MEAIFRAYCDSWAVREAGINLFLEPRCDDSSQTTTTTQWDLALKKKSTMLTTHNTQTFFLFLSLSLLKRMCVCPKIFKHKNKDIVSLNSYRSQTGVQFFRDIFIVSGEKKTFFRQILRRVKNQKASTFEFFISLYLNTIIVRWWSEIDDDDVDEDDDDDGSDVDDA